MSPDGAAATPDDWAGRSLGLPPSGPGSVAGVGRRVLAIAIDWGTALLVSRAFFDSDPWATLVVFLLVQWLLVSSLGAGFGHTLLRMRVVRVGGGAPGPTKAAIRTVLIGLAVPPVVFDADQRGLHDRAAGTVLVRR